MAQPFRLGLTGSIGMGKSTTAALFAARGLPVWDADQAVHRLYAPGGGAVAGIAALCPAAKGPDGGINRGALKDWIARDPAALQQIEALVHPLVAADRAAFLARNAQAPVVVFDIPLLFETGSAAQMDAVAVVSAPPAIQRARVLARPGMTEAQLDLILSRQISDAEKRTRADFVIPTTSPAAAEAAVTALLKRIIQPHA